MQKSRQRDDLNVASVLAKVGPSMFMIILVIMIVMTCADQLHAIRALFHIPR